MHEFIGQFVNHALTNLLQVRIDPFCKGFLLDKIKFICAREYMYNQQRNAITIYNASNDSMQHRYSVQEDVNTCRVCEGTH